MPLHVVTFLTDESNPGFIGNLMPSCRHHGFSLTVLRPARMEGAMLGARRWLGGRVAGVWRPKINLRMKDGALRRYIAALPDNDLVLFSDGYDALFVGPSKELVEKYRALKRPIVFSAQHGCYPDRDLAPAFAATQPVPSYMNSGGFIGSVGAIREAYREMETIDASKYPRSNQYRWQLTAIKRNDLIGVDVNRSIFTCLGRFADATLLRSFGGSSRVAWRDQEFRKRQLEVVLQDIEVSQGRVRFRPTGEFPCHVHFHGRISLLMDNPVFDQLRPWLGQRSGSAMRAMGGT